MQNRSAHSTQRFLMGSNYFFQVYPDFQVRDTDTVEILKDVDFMKRQKFDKGSCLFQLKQLNTAQEYIDYALDSPIGMVVGKFLIPEFAQAIGMTIKDLPKLQPLIDNLDYRHKYEEIIYNAYLQNGSFTLTQEQRDAAYLSYKQSRNLI